jgi:hypothetical protein
LEPTSTVPHTRRNGRRRTKSLARQEEATVDGQDRDRELSVLVPSRHADAERVAVVATGDDSAQRGQRFFSLPVGFQKSAINVDQ